MEIDWEQVRVFQALTPAQKFQAAWRLFESAQQLKAAAIRAKHPDWSEAQVRSAVREAFLYAVHEPVCCLTHKLNQIGARYMITGSTAALLYRARRMDVEGEPVFVSHRNG